MADLVYIKTYLNRPEAELGKGLLEANGIKAMVSADDAGGMRPDLMQATGGVRLLVREGDKEIAIRILER